MALITNIDQVRDHVQNVDSNTRIEVFKTGFTFSERSYLKPKLGTALYNAFIADFDANQNDISSMEQQFQDLLPYAEAVVVFFGILNSLDRNKVQIDDNSVTILSDSQRKTAFQDQSDDLKENLRINAFAALEDLLIFLAENYQAGVTYDAWDPAIFHEFYVTTVEDCRGFVSAISGRDIFEFLKPHFNAGKDAINNIIGQTFADELLSAEQAATTTALQIKVVNLLKPVQVHYAIYDLLLQSPGSIRTDGTFVTQTAAIKENTRERTLIKSEKKIRYHKDKYDKAKKKLKLFLDANAADYPTYLASDYYSDPILKTKEFTNTDTTTFWN